MLSPKPQPTFQPTLYCTICVRTPNAVRYSPAPPVFRRCPPACTDQASSESLRDAGCLARFSVRLSLCSLASCLRCDANCHSNLSQLVTVAARSPGLELTSKGSAGKNDNRQFELPTRSLGSRTFYLSTTCNFLVEKEALRLVARCGFCTRPANTDCDLILLMSGAQR